MNANQHLDKLAFRFFKLFARYESTLKERGYFRVERKDRIVVDWDRFANEVVGAHFIDALSDKAKSAKFILQQPPMRQAANDEGKIVWKEVSNKDQSVQAMFGHICRIRNNLFHGAKFNGTWFDPGRSKSLLEHGLVILEHYREWIDRK